MRGQQGAAVDRPALLGPARQALEPDARAVRQPGLVHGARGARRALAALRPPHRTAPARARWRRPRRWHFFPRWSRAQDRVLAYGILGGMPAYLRRFDDRRSLRENLLREVLRPEGYLFDEVQFLLRNELTNPSDLQLDPGRRGARRASASATSRSRSASTRPPPTSTCTCCASCGWSSARSRSPTPTRCARGAAPTASPTASSPSTSATCSRNLSLIDAGRGARVLEEFVEPDLERLFDEARVEFVLDHLRREAAELVGEEIVEVGPPRRAPRARRGAHRGRATVAGWRPGLARAGRGGLRELAGPRARLRCAGGELADDGAAAPGRGGRVAPERLPGAPDPAETVRPDAGYDAGAVR